MNLTFNSVYFRTSSTKFWADVLVGNFRINSDRKKDTFKQNQNLLHLNCCWKRKFGAANIYRISNKTNFGFSHRNRVIKTASEEPIFGDHCSEFCSNFIAFFSTLFSIL